VVSCTTYSLLSVSWPWPLAGSVTGGGNSFFAIPQEPLNSRPDSKRARLDNNISVETIEDEEDMEEPVLESTVDPADAFLDNIARQQQERKAVKLDDAAVPECLWEEHLTAGSSVTKWDAKAMDDLRRVSSWLRERMLCWWKRKVVSSYIAWMKEKYKIEPSSLGEDTVNVNLAGGGQEWIGYG
jgi:hypothetical protein